MSAASPPAFHADVLAGVRHGFFGREGGVSRGIYASLNAGTGSDDDVVAVADNRALIAQAMGVEPTHLIGVHQVHSPNAAFVDAPWTGERPQADALVTTVRGLAISVLTADCTPVLLADADTGVIGAAHAGWKGALGGVLESAVALMREHGATRIAAAIGPCIHQRSYEVGPEFEAAFLARDAGFARFFVPGKGDRRLFDLPEFCADRLKQAGVVEIETLPLDTYTEESRLFSHRRSVHRKEPGYGRNCAAIAL
ncbi:peptidoglycan editing factor PgeF [Terricaulis silvestris]|uniref:Purine nucleoside phosphorylase n=1 Tax=Terricaulis silvestris TaxID=2686094 RepID=A0A6I6MMI3_9CAUL|nr:peptidoglycan editing factor PgeF [Terricaulis silvestris]QGZ94174.1 Laccase domain protein YfiH [Terricaulis silvestris]